MSQDARAAAVTALAHTHRMIQESLEELLSLRSHVRRKEDGSPVTEADILLEERIHAGLRQDLGAVSLIGEESGGTDTPRTGWIAVVDPIDGTENFTSGLKEWGTAVSLWHDRQHAASMLLLPELGDCLTTGDSVEVFESRIDGFSSSLSSELIEGLSRVEEARMIGCSVYNMSCAIRGSFRSFVNPKGAWVWDLLAGLQLAREHGCHVVVEGREYTGEFLEPDKRYRFQIRR